MAGMGLVTMSGEQSGPKAEVRRPLGAGSGRDGKAGLGVEERAG